ncbi:MAG: Trk system potassium transporter TrkA [Sedimentisphaerales bacterium]|nr:Trk system potassium transporter TrkA [Sedimentisphaerales bacterium]
MRVIIAGAGEIGWYVAEVISADGHDVTLIDDDDEKIRQVASDLDVQCLCGSAASAAILEQAQVARADLFVAVTGRDDTNLVSASLARKLGAARSIARVDEVIYRKAPQISYLEHFGIDELVSPEMLAALELASVVRNPGTLAVEHFARGALEMQQFVADRGARHVGKPLTELSLPEGVRIASIQRGGQFLIPTGHDHVDHGDLLTLIGKTEQVVEARSGFESDKPASQKVVIMGGGHTALSLARRLRSHSYRLTVIEHDPDRCQMLAAILSTATILNGDGTKLSFLKEERIDNADFFISTTASDEANILSAMQAKNLGVKKVLVVIHRPDYADLMERLGIDRAVSPRAVMAHEMLSWLRKDSVSVLARIENGRAEILELLVKGEDFVGKTLRQVTLPAGCLVLTLQRPEEISVPAADTVFQLEDIILVICLPQVRKEVVRLITGKA